jgi:hypothetical protein
MIPLNLKIPDHPPPQTMSTHREPFPDTRVSRNLDTVYTFFEPPASARLPPYSAMATFTLTSAWTAWWRRTGTE